MHDAAREMFGPAFTFDGVEVAGRIDSLIWADMARVNGIADPDAHHDRFRAIYLRHLTQRIETESPVEVLPGVRSLLFALRDADDLTLGVLTGNYPETGRLKLEAAGIDLAWFPVAVWGSDAASRRDLTPLAMSRQETLTGRRLEPGNVVVIGDTPHDVDCARASGCRSLAVATGPYQADDLAASGADLVVKDLSETESLVKWFINREPVAESLSER
jgi:phosphoglycolate phosphatase-like HAD superfamily hydrolase